tara:strand:- start:72 stop:842 length:771 start_codon:yes stop_codon:yes gene_type:complete
MSSIHRDLDLEDALQAALEMGYSVWAVGDVHGHRDEFEEVLHRLRLCEGDIVLCVGDLVDRGPDSHGVLSRVKDDARIFSLKGNHEMIMSEALGGDMQREAFWINKVGGDATLDSMPGEGDEKWKRAKEWLEFTDSLPTEVVLDDFRLSHSGYRIDIPLEEQTDQDRLKSREVFLAEQAPDPSRQIIAGHTPVQMLGRFGVEPPNEGIWRSEVETEDGRAAAVLIDTGIVLRDKSHRPRISSYDLQTGNVVEVERF